jgi:hypothetical protein
MADTTTIADPAATTTAAVDVLPLPVFAADKSGLRLHGDDTAAASLSASADQVVEACWSVENADLLQLTRNGEEIDEPRRATDGFCPLSLAGLEPGDYQYQLIPGVAESGGETWVKDAALSFTLTLTPALRVTQFSGDPEPDDDGKDHLAQDLQIAEGSKVKLSFEAKCAKQVQISAAPEDGEASALSPLVDLDEEGKGTLTVDPGDKLTVYTAVAVDGDAKSAPSAKVTVHFHAAEAVVSPLVDVVGGASARLLIRADDGTLGPDAKLKAGARDGLQLEWTVAGAKGAHLSATALVQKPVQAPEAQAAGAHVANDQLLTSGLDLPLDALGSGSGLVVVDPGPTGSTEYTLTVTPEAEGVEEVSAKATAYVANFNVQIKLPGGGLAKNKTCSLEIGGQEPVTGTTNDSGELWLWLANTAASVATLRVLDGGQELASWALLLEAEEGVAEGLAAVDDAPSPADP